MEFALIVLPFILAAATPFLATSLSAKWISRLIAGSLLVLFVWVCTLLPAIHEHFQHFVRRSQVLMRMFRPDRS